MAFLTSGEDMPPDRRNKINRVTANLVYQYHLTKNITSKTRPELKQAIQKRKSEVVLDGLYIECQQQQDKKVCAQYKSATQAHNKKYGLNYKPWASPMPKINFFDYTYTMPEGKTYVLKKVNQPKPPKENKKMTADNSEDFIMDPLFNTKIPLKEVKEKEKCKWDDMGGKEIIKVPVVGGKEGEICSGFVNCSANRVLRQHEVTCSVKNCNSESAQACYDEKGYTVANVKDLPQRAKYIPPNPKKAKKYEVNTGR